MRILLTLAIALAGLATMPAHGQNSYSRAIGDTLLYEDATDVEVNVQTPQGPMDVTATSRSELEITFSSSDTVVARFRLLDVSAQSPMGTQRPPTSAVVGAPFRVYFPPNGDATTVSAPITPAELRAMSDVSRQFDDFFLVLPDDELRPGYSWPYRVERSEEDSDGSYAFSKEGVLTVTGDTVVAGMNALVIEGDLSSSMSVSRYDPMQGASVSNEFKGNEHNVFFFAQEAGIMVGRDRKASLSGTTLIEGPMPMTLDQQIRYESRLILVP